MDSLQIQDAFEPYYQGRKEPFQQERKEPAVRAADAKTRKPEKTGTDTAPSPSQGKH